MSKASNRPAWWPTPEQKAHADAGCAHPDECRLESKQSAPMADNLNDEDLAEGYVIDGDRVLVWTPDDAEVSRRTADGPGEGHPGPSAAGRRRRTRTPRRSPAE